MGGPTRFPYGQGMGFVNQFSAYGASLQTGAGQFSAMGTAGLISIGTPDVTVGDLFIANNTGSVVVTYFNLQQYAYKSADYSGKQIRILVLDNGSTTFANSNQLFLQGTDNLSTANTGSPALYQFVQFNSSWFQTDFSRPNRNEVTTFLLTGASSLNVNGLKLGLLNNTGGTVDSISAFSGGQVGQVISFALVGSNSVKIVSGGNIFLAAGTSAVVINASGVYQFTNVGGGFWRQSEIV